MSLSLYVYKISNTVNAHYQNVKSSQHPHGGEAGFPLKVEGTKVNPVEKKAERPWEYPIEIRHGLGL
jgi:hypothetical protein